MPLPLLERLLLYEKKFDKRNLFKDSTASINYSRQPKKSSLIIIKLGGSQLRNNVIFYYNNGLFNCFQIPAFLPA